jgi:hypothetical protein
VCLSLWKETLASLEAPIPQGQRKWNLTIGLSVILDSRLCLWFLGCCGCSQLYIHLPFLPVLSTSRWKKTNSKIAEPASTIMCGQLPITNHLAYYFVVVLLLWWSPQWSSQQLCFLISSVCSGKLGAWSDRPWGKEIIWWHLRLCWWDSLISFSILGYFLLVTPTYLYLCASCLLVSPLWTHE